MISPSNNRSEVGSGAFEIWMLCWVFASRLSNAIVKDSPAATSMQDPSVKAIPSATTVTTPPWTVVHSCETGGGGGAGGAGRGGGGGGGGDVWDVPVAAHERVLRLRVVPAEIGVGRLRADRERREGSSRGRASGPNPVERARSADRELDACRGVHPRDRHLSRRVDGDGGACALDVRAPLGGVGGGRDLERPGRAGREGHLTAAVVGEGEAVARGGAGQATAALGRRLAAHPPPLPAVARDLHSPP